MRYDGSWKPTVSQLRLLNEVHAKGIVKKNGLARKPIERLEAQGLVNVDWDLVIPADGKTYWIITVTPKEAR